MVRVITIWDEIFLKLVVSFDGLVRREKVFSESSHDIGIHIYVFGNVFEFQISVSFDFCLGEELKGFW